MTGDTSWDHDIPNAWMASRKEHPFWLHVLGLIMKNVERRKKEGGGGGAEEVTGPVALMNVWRAYHENVPVGEREPVQLLEKGMHTFRFTYCCLRKSTILLENMLILAQITLQASSTPTSGGTHHRNNFPAGAAIQTKTSTRRHARRSSTLRESRIKRLI